LANTLPPPTDTSLLPTETPSPDPGPDPTATDPVIPHRVT
jgi:hypothetical protein